MGPPREQREDLADKALGQITDARAPYRHRPIHHRERTGVAVAVAAPGWGIDRRHRAPALVSGAAEEGGHFLLQQLL